MADLNIDLTGLAELTPYNEGLVAERTTLIELKAIYGLSALRDGVTETGTGTVTNDAREYALNITGISSKSELQSLERGRYISGKSAEYGIGIRSSVATVTGDTVLKWGGINSTNGMYFGLDSTGLFVAVLDDSVETKIYQTDWNSDKLNGAGASGVTLDITTGVIYNARFTWYGYGVIDFRVQIKTITGVKTIVAHRFIVDGKTSIADPNLPITASIEQTTATNDVSVYVGGRQFSVLGSYTPSFRSLVDYRLAVSTPVLDTNPTPLISFKQKSAFASVDGKFVGLNISTNNKIVVEVYIANAAQLTGASFATPTRILASETAFEVDKSATAFDASTGNILYRDFIEGASGNNRLQRAIDNLLLDIPSSKILVVTAFAASTTATVDVAVELIEEW